MAPPSQDHRPAPSGSAQARSGTSAARCQPGSRGWNGGRGPILLNPAPRVLRERRPSPRARGTDLPHLHLALRATPRSGQEVAPGTPRLVEARRPSGTRTPQSPGFRLGKARGGARMIFMVPPRSPRPRPGTAGNCSSWSPFSPRPGPARPAGPSSPSCSAPLAAS